MSILVNENTKALIQGITGNEGSRACREMRAYGTEVLAGVTPGKGGQNVDGVPVYDTVAEAVARHSALNASLIAVPGAFVRKAATEVLDAGIPLVDILTENVPTQDSAYIVQYAREKNARIVGPASVGIISPGRGKIGSVGSGSTRNVFTEGHIGLISKSGGMTAEIAHILTIAGLGQSTAVGIGGDQIIGSDFVDVLLLFEKDPDTHAVVLFGEIGGTYEERVAEFVTHGKLTKPIIAIVAGEFTIHLPERAVLGHAGAIVSRGRGGYDSKIQAFTRAGVALAYDIDDIPKLVKEAL